MAIGCYWLIGVPLGITFAKKLEWGVPGLFAGIGCACFTECCLYAMITYMSDWNRIAKEAAERIAKESEALVDDDKSS